MSRSVAPEPGTLQTPAAVALRVLTAWMNAHPPQQTGSENFSTLRCVICLNWLPQRTVKTVLILEDDDSSRFLLEAVLDKEYRVVVTASPEEAIRIANSNRPTCLYLTTS